METKPPKEQAVELVNRHFLIIGGSLHENDLVYKGTKLYQEAILSSLLTVNKILEATKVKRAKLKPNHVYFYYEYSEYWQEVKNEIEKQTI